MERTLEMNASIACGTGLLLGWLVNPRWFLFSAGVMAFLLQHALQGWCPPMPVFRWLGWRTAYEITDMVVALHVLAGDLDFIKAAGAGRQELAERMAANMASRGYFVGGSALRGGNKGGVSTGRQTPGAAALTSKQE